MRVTKVKFNIIGMSCSACASHIEKVVAQQVGVTSVNVNLLQNFMTVIYDSDVMTKEQICDTVAKAGYKAIYQDDNQKNKQQYSVDEKKTKSRLILSIIFTIPLFYIAMGHMFGWPLPNILHNFFYLALSELVLTLPVIWFNRKYYINGFSSLFRGSPNMDSLIAIGSGAALIYGIFTICNMFVAYNNNDQQQLHDLVMDLYFESAAMILTLVTVGKYFESKSKNKTSNAIAQLVNLSPQTAVLLDNGVETLINIADVKVGDILVVKAGAAIPVDGSIIEGGGSVDESMLTGESMPVKKQVGSKIIGATINQSGYFKMKAERVGQDTTLSQIISLVEDATLSQAKISKLADKVAGIFVPLVIIISVISFICWLYSGVDLGFAISIGISVLVISCPCALGLATPTAIMVGTGKGAENGILMKSAEALETLSNVDIVLLDKTGTVTEGRPVVTDIITYALSEADLLALAGSIEIKSEHLLAQAIVKVCVARDIEFVDVDSYEAIPGEGITAKIDDSSYFIGNASMMQKHNISLADAAEDKEFSMAGKTTLYVSDESKLLGIIAIADVVKAESKQAVYELVNTLGVDTYLLTGDNALTAKSIAEQVGISEVIAQVLPADKEQVVRKLQSHGKVVAMVGDGINDAPALAAADVGIAIGAGSDIAIDAADVVLMKNSLLDIVTALELSHHVVINIKENLFWAFIYNCIGIPLAAGVFFPFLGWKLNPMFAAAAMSFSSICVVTNALRLRKFKPSFDDKVLPANNDSTRSVNVHIYNNNNGGQIMVKKMIIDGMSCSHCSGRVEEALNKLAGAKATVDLTSKTATVELSTPVADEKLTKVVEDAGYKVISIS